AAQFDGNLTLQSTFGQLSATRKSRSLIQCWSSESPSRISFDRPGGLPRYSQQLLQGDEAHVLLLPPSAGLSRAGPFTCQQAAGGIVTSAATLKLPPSGKAQILPVKAYVVAYMGDTVQLSVTKQLRRPEPLIWSLEGLELPEFENQETITLKDVESADAGVYECHYRGQRKAMLHAWIRLIVVGCPKGKFGPTCKQDCPPCRNGGICHDTWGVCICPAGFAGPNCDIACGENRVGAQCERTCSPPGQGTNARHGCAIHLFCKPDPLGCSCAPGFKGPHCSQGCPEDYYGADCLQKCRCASPSDCDAITGHCLHGCALGWGGDSCQIYVGEQTETAQPAITTKPECEPGRFGKNCSKLCHCADDEACDPSTGVCPASCKDGYSRPTCSVCLPGRFGDNCSLSCHCWNGHENCGPDGHCHDGCAPGWTGEYCQEGCSEDTFGPDCAYACHCATNSTPDCDPVSGACGMCEPGYRGPSCQEKCSPGTHGANCSLSCECLHGEACHHADGTCSCTGRHRGRRCDQLAPKVLEGEESEVKQGESALVSCTVEGSPAPVVQLYYQENGKTLGNVSVKALGGDLYKATAPLSDTLKDGMQIFQCSARNKHGFDVGTVQVDIVAAPVLSSPPEVEVSSDHAEISWKPWSWGPNSGGRQGDIIHYQVLYRTEGAHNWTIAGPWQETTTANVSGLLPDTEYEFAVVLRRSNVSTAEVPEPETWAFARTLCGEPSPQSAPQELEVKSVSENRLSIQWKHPEQDQLHCQLAGYEVHLRRTKDSGDLVQVRNVGAEVQSTEFDNLEPDTPYRVDLYPVTSLGRAPFNSSIDAMTEEGVPGPVTDLTVAWVNSSEALVTWQPPEVRNGTPVEFKVKLHPRDVGGCGMTDPEDVFLVRHSQFLGKGLAPHSLYRVSVSAGTDKGYGEQQELSFLTEGAVPGASPEKVKVIWAGPRSLFLSWEPVPCRELHGPLLFYECTFKPADGSIDTFIANATEPNVTLHGLQPFRKYMMRVRAVNAFGQGPLSPPVMQTTTQDIPGKPEQFRVEEVTGTTVQLHWEEPQERNGVLVEYEVLVESSDEDNRQPEAKTTVLASDDRTVTLTGLSPGRSYKALVRGLTIVGPGPYAVSHFETAPPGEPIGPSDVFAWLPSQNWRHSHNPNNTPLLCSYYEVVLSKQKLGSSTAASYPVAKVHAKSNSSTEYFTVGDGLYHGGFFNGPLLPSTSYKVIMLAAFENGQSRVSG
ncbi:unnamed protein product, partial [Ixodes hexagonus]